ncbi:MAG: 2Fe-2S iron-sulfur cluster binding domain-containing protein, partial [Deltaproteobacteria bacterium]|nr:2Fe-2S iron-sulfur cluster binding domain-containing protein [Deltaproteobacteria bacterium]
MIITIKQAGAEDRTITAEDGQTLLEALSSQGMRLDAPCGGRGKCGKCVVKAEGDLSPPDALESKFAEGVPGARLACKAVGRGDITMTLEDQVVFSSPKAMGWSAPYEIKPSLRETDLEIMDRQDPTGSLDARGISTHDVGALNEIALVDGTYSRGRALVWLDELLEAWPIGPGNDRKTGPLAAAFDLGTTGLALAVIDLSQNKVI